MMRIPFVRIRHNDDLVQASSGYALVAIQHERLHQDPSGTSGLRERIEEVQTKSVRLLQLLSRWEHPFVLELHLVIRPSLDNAEPGRVDIALQLHVSAQDRSTAVERCLSQSLNLGTLLNTLWDHADFEPIRTAGDFDRRFLPFSPETCVQIKRRAHQISLAQPFALGSKPLGFQATGKTPVESDAVVDHLFPWAPPLDSWKTLLETALQYPAAQWIVARVANTADAAPEAQRLQSVIQDCERFLAAAPADQVTLSTQIHCIRETCLLQMSRLSECSLRGTVLLCAPGTVDPVMASLLGQSISGDLTRGSAKGVYQGGFQVELCSPDAATRPFEFLEEAPMSSEEAACAFRLPLIASEQDLGLPVQKNRTVAAPFPTQTEDADGATTLGINRHRSSERPIQAELDHRLKHVFLIGMTGTGKSTMMLSLLLQDLRRGHGVCLIDPHGELADELLARYPQEREDDLIVIDLADRQHPVPLNLLAWQSLEERDVIIDQLLSALLRIYRDQGMFGPIFEMHFRAMLKLLMGDRPRPEEPGPFTLLDFPRLYQSAAFRHHLVERTGDEQVKDFVRELEKVGYGDHKPENIAPYITAKFARFTQDTMLGRIFGHGAMALNFRSIMDSGKVLVLKLARGQFGTSVADLVTAQVVSRFYVAALGRAGTPKSTRRPFFLHVDELGTLARDETFSRLLSESRKYHLGLVLATQYASQLRDPEYSRNLLSSVLGNVGTVICYRVGVEDAGILAPIFAPAMTAQDLVECPNYQGYMKLHRNRDAARAFSFHNQLDSTVPSLERAKRLCRLSRQRWAVSVEECEERAEARRRFIRSLEEET